MYLLIAIDKIADPFFIKPYKNMLLINNNKKASKFLTKSDAFYGGECGIRTHVGVSPNGFQDRLVMTTSITLHIKKVPIRVLFWRRRRDLNPRALFTRLLP